MSDAIEKSQQFTQRLLALLYQALALLLAVLAVMGCLALFSYEVQDPGWHNLATQPTKNWMGFSGAWVADVVFSLLGQAGWILPWVLIYSAIQLLRQPWQAEDWSPFIPSLRLLGLLLVVVAIAGLAAQHFNHDSNLPYGAGGILGVSLLSSLAAWIGPLGLTLLMLSCLLLGASLLGGFSWLMVMDELGHALVQAYDWIAQQLPNIKSHVASRWQDWRAPPPETEIVAQAQRLVTRPQRPLMDQEPTLSSSDAVPSSLFADSSLTSEPLLPLSSPHHLALQQGVKTSDDIEEMEAQWRPADVDSASVSSLTEDEWGAEHKGVVSRSDQSEWDASELDQTEFDPLELEPTLIEAAESEEERLNAKSDLLYDEVVDFVLDQGRVSTSSIQRRFKIGYSQAVGLIEAMEAAGLVSPLQPDGQRVLLVPHTGQS